MGDRLSGRADAEGACGVAAAGERDSIAVKAGYPPEDTLDDADLAAARWAWEHDRPAGRGSDTLPGAKRLFLPMRTGRGAIGIVGIDSDKPGPLLTPDQRRLLDALIDQGALAIERVFLVEDVDRAKRSIEADRLRSALLTSISHDLKTPLAAILGAAGTLRELSGALDDAAKAELLTTIIDESERLNRFIANLLDMTRLESGAVVPKTALHDLESSSAARSRARQDSGASPGRCRARGRSADARAGPGAVRAGAVQPARQRREIRACRARRFAFDSWREGSRSCLQVLDEGDGIPPEISSGSLTSSTARQKADHVRAGTGLGLAISRGFVEALMGTITAANRTDRSGAVFTIRLPVPAASQKLDTAA